MEQWSEVKAVEFWQPANDNIGAVSVVLDVVYKLRIAHSCRAVFVLRKASEACVNRRLRRYYLIVLLLPNIFTLACLLLSSI